MTVPDEDLAEAARKGDREAFSLLISMHYDRIFRLAFRLTGNRAETEDLTQDICAALPGKLMSWRREARFSTWLYRVVINTCHDRRRRTASHLRAAEGWGEHELSRQAERHEAREAQCWLDRAMSLLPLDLRDTVALVVTEEMTHAQAAEILDIPEGTVSWRMSEVKKRLRRMAEDEDA